MPQLDFRHIFRLDLIDAEAHHQVGHHFLLVLGFPDDVDGLVDVQQDFPKALEQMQLVLRFFQVEFYPPGHAVLAEIDPLQQNPLGPQHLGHAVNEDVEVAGIGVLQGGHFEQPVHELVRVGAPLQLHGDL